MTGATLWRCATQLFVATALIVLRPDAAAARVVRIEITSRAIAP